MIQSINISRHINIVILILVTQTGCQSVDKPVQAGIPAAASSKETKAPTPSLAQRQTMPAAVQAAANLSGADIISRAHTAAGGTTFVNPGTLFLTGYNIIRRDEQEVLWDRYAMWRKFSADKSDAHTASGKVRIEAWTADSLAMLISFDGSKTYNQNGPMEDQSANAMWSSNFGFGAIRHALDDGWQQTRRPDRLIDGAATFMIELSDPSGGQTLFGVRQNDYALVYVGFDTPRGWHERRYSHFFKKPGISWNQAGRVRLFYDGIKTNEAVWTDFDIAQDLPDSLFEISHPPPTPTF